DVNLAVRPEGRAFAVPAISEAPDLFTGLGVEAIHAGVLIADVEPAFVDDRRGELDLQAVHLPDQFRLAILYLEASRQTTRPSLVPSRFSAPWPMKTKLPSTTGAQLTAAVPKR